APPHPPSTLFPYTTLFRSMLSTPWPFITLLGVLSLALALPFWQRLMSHIPGTFLRSPSRQVYMTDFALAMALGGAVCLATGYVRSEEHTSELQSLRHLVCR